VGEGSCPRHTAAAAHALRIKGMHSVEKFPLKAE